MVSGAHSPTGYSRKPLPVRPASHVQVPSASRCPFPPHTVSEFISQCAPMAVPVQAQAGSSGSGSPGSHTWKRLDRLCRGKPVGLVEEVPPSHTVHPPARTPHPEQCVVSVSSPEQSTDETPRSKQHTMNTKASPLLLVMPGALREQPLGGVRRTSGCVGESVCDLGEGNAEQDHLVRTSTDVAAPGADPTPPNDWSSPLLPTPETPTPAGRRNLGPFSRIHP